MTKTFIKYSLKCFCLLIACLSTFTFAAEKLKLTVQESYIELRTGPGKSYPVFYIAQRGENIEVQKRRTNWYKVKLQSSKNRSQTGWIHKKDIINTTVANNHKKTVLAKDHPRLKSALHPKIYLGFNYGQTSKADSAGIYGGYSLTPNFAIELQANEIIGNTFERTSWAANASFTPFDLSWYVAPFFQIGGGGIDNKVRGTGSRQNEGSDKFFQSTAGLGILLSKRYRLRLEYKHQNILQSRNNNREVETWQIGFIGYW